MTLPFQFSRMAMATALASILRHQVEPPTPRGGGPQASRGQVAANAFALSGEERRRVILDPSLAPAPKARVRPGVKSKIFRP